MPQHSAAINVSRSSSSTSKRASKKRAGGGGGGFITTDLGEEEDDDAKQGEEPLRNAKNTEKEHGKREAAAGVSRGEDTAWAYAYGLPVSHIVNELNRRNPESFRK